jgi:hypothetical protein
MPYRRLPNTDASRIRALRTALRKGKDLPPVRLAYPAKIVVSLERFLPKFETGMQQYRESMASQTKKNREYFEAFRKARTYLAHFVKVMNMAIYRGELPSETRAFFGLPTDDPGLPPLNTENELITWGKRIIEGEEYRIRKSGSPITNPTIAVVKIRFGSFLDLLNHHKSLVQKTADLSEGMEKLRKEADHLILEIWNEVERSFSGLAEEERRINCEDYGLVYFFRKNELEKNDADHHEAEPIAS